MILPIYTYGHPVLKKVADPIEKDYEGLEELIENMWETMYNAKGVGLAAPQIGRSIRLFIIDTAQLDDEENPMKGVKKVFINAEKVAEKGPEWSYEEGCLSIPDIRGDVERNLKLKIKYLDENFEEHEDVFTALNARVILHEYDHIEGTLFTEKLKPIKKRRIKRRLEQMRQGNVEADYAVRPYRG